MRMTHWLHRSCVAALAVILGWAAAPAAAGADAAVAKGLRAYLAGDFKSAHDHWQGLAGDGEARAQFGLAVLYASGRGVAKDPARAVALYRKAADQGHPTAAFRLGQAYAEGKGTAKDPDAAERWYRRAAEAGHESAYTVIGIRYRDAVPADTAKTVAFYRKGAEAGYADAQYNMGNFHARGRGVEADPAKAREFYRQAARQGHAEAALRLGGMYEDGNGVKRDFAKAAKWYRRAAERGMAAAQLSLGKLYDKGKGVATDKVAAYKWYRLSASEQGVFQQPARRKADKVAKILSDSEKKKADAWVEQWLADGIWTRHYGN